jgi:hypothetical protein
MTDGDLRILQANAKRLAADGSGEQQAEAERLLSIINAEVDARAPGHAKAPKAARKSKKSGDIG